MNYQYPYQQYPNGFNYPQQPQQYAPNQVQNPLIRNNQPTGNGIIWVQGEEGAKAYMVGAGNSVVLWDSESPTIFIKSADLSGMPSMRILEWQERVSSPSPSKQTGDFITRKEFDELKSRIETMIGGENNVSKKQSDE